MNKYVDGFVIPIPKKNLKAYRKMAKNAGKIWIKHGALEYWECVGNDFKVNVDPTNKSKFTFPFPKKFTLKRTETVLFSWIVYKSKAHRDKVNSKVMKDPKMKMEEFDAISMPFDINKMLYAGFTPIVKMKK
jgi:uncharacterized protein YbaA (DUF1428 family)